MTTRDVDRVRVRKYFKGSIGPIVLIIIGIVPIVGIFLIIGGIIWLLIDRFGGKPEVEAEIDQLISSETNRMRERGMEKLNIIGEQVNIIKPIYLHGPSYNPAPAIEANTAFGLSSIFTLIFRIVFLPIWAIIKIVKHFSKDDDPVWMSKVGSDGKWRYSLIEITVFLFDEKQIYIYYAHLDLTTGLIYNEGTQEYFYADICGVSTNQVYVKILNAKKKKMERKLVESISIYASGCSHKASMTTDIDSSFLDKQFTAMKNLIREKKWDRV